MRNEDQEKIIIEASSRLVSRCIEQAESGNQPLDEVLADTVYHELQRLRQQPNARLARKDKEFYKALRSSMSQGGQRAQAKLIGDVVSRYIGEIAGKFDPKVYQAVTRAGIPAVGSLLNAVSPIRLLRDFPNLPSLDETVILQGNLEQLRRLREIGTVILVPTHVSNLDSIVVGLALHRLGLPPFIYGAGLNLFENPVMGFFLSNLGAYTVDRQKTDPTYKATLKEYATLTQEHGYDNIFFPGGTRSRSGAIEAKLKLGLLGSGINAYINNLKYGRKNPKIFIIPVTLSFQLVLEAETLIDDFLKDVGKSRYIITDDEFAQPQRVFDFMRQLFTLDSKTFFTVSQAIDPFGNMVDDEGNSISKNGSIVDPRDYVLVDGKPEAQAQRDAEYTKEVGERISDAFFRDNVIQTTNVVAFSLLKLLRENHPEIALIRLIRAGGVKEDVTLQELYHEVGILVSELIELANKEQIRLSPDVKNERADDIVDDALKHFSIFHSKKAAVRKGDRVFPEDRQLLFYYANRLEGYPLAYSAGLKPALSDDHRSIRG
jgi:glycerol-3-phosphate O-acyltransferase